MFIKIIKKVSDDRDYNNPFVKRTAIFMLVFFLALIFNHTNLLDKYSFFVRLLIAGVIGGVTVHLFMLITWGLYKLYKRLMK